jgi:hypothetical protein|eukprot:COSAG06_NODE_1649_length_8808_cov_14.990010_3_plen_181_part_00
MSSGGYADGNWYCVRRIELKHTLLEGLDKKQALWANAVLRSKHPLENLSRSQTYMEQFTMAVDSVCFGSGELVSKVSSAMQQYADARPDVFSGTMWVVNTGPVDKAPGFFSATTRTETGGMKMGLSLRIQYASGVVLQSRWLHERSNLLDAWCAALSAAGAKFSGPQDSSVQPAACDHSN